MRNLNPLIQYLLVLLVLTFLSACQTGYPMGMKKSEWADLSPTERADMRVKQAALNSARDAALVDQQAKENARIEKLYADAKPGDVVHCVIEGGRAVFSKQLNAYRPLAFRLAKGEQKYIKILEAKFAYLNNSLWGRSGVTGWVLTCAQ